MQEEGRGGRGAPDHICIFFIYLYIYALYTYLYKQKRRLFIHIPTSLTSLSVSPICVYKQTRKIIK